MTKSFRGGIHPPYRKELAKDKPIEEFPPPEEVVVALSQHIGAPCKPVVKRRDEVKKGQMIGEPGGFVSAPVHSPVSGRVKRIEPAPHPLGKSVLSVIIENDGEESWVDGANQRRDWSTLSADELKAEIQKAGIVGLGGATFPTHVKLSPPPDKPIDTVILNGAECEPYLCADHRLMLEKPAEIVEGLRVILKILRVSRAIIAIEANKLDAYEAIRAHTNGEIELELLEVKYPQGAEKQLIKAVLGREVPPPPGLPMDVGVVVQNVATSYAVFEAIVLNKPLIERVISVSGEGVKDPCNLLTRIGTPIRLLLERAGMLPGVNKVILGGPMMGLAQYCLETPTTKGVNGIVAFVGASLPEHGPCIRCGKCVESCVMGLNPSELSIILENRDLEALKQTRVMDCIECGCCTYGCPAKRPIVHWVKFGKAELARFRAQEKKT